MSRKLISALAAMASLVAIAAINAYVGVPDVDKFVYSILLLGGGHQLAQTYLDSRNG